MLELAVRDLEAIQLPQWGQVRRLPGTVPWLVVDPAGVPVDPIRRFLMDFVARDNRAGSVRSYAYDLLRWWRWLRVSDVLWDKAKPDDVRDLVLWMKQATKPRRAPRTASAATAGTINPITRKQYLDDQYKPRTIRHSNAVLRTFYEYWIDLGEGPLINPVQLSRRGSPRPNAHHNPLASFRPEGKLRYNPKVAKRRPRAMSDQQWVKFFGALRSNRDRALLALAISNAARASELLGIRGSDLNWGEQLVRVVRKGTQAEQWLPASPDAFVWLRLYVAELGELKPDQLLWWTLRRRDHGQGLHRQPLNYEAFRAVVRRANQSLGTNWSIHDLRHTCALRMARDDTLSLRDVQAILGHAHLSTTAEVYLVEEDDAILARVAVHLAERGKPAAPPVTTPGAVGYDASDLDILFGGTLQ